MNVKKFLNIEIEEAPPELQLSVEMRCREIMQSEDYDNIKRYCTHLVRHQMHQDVFIILKQLLLYNYLDLLDFLVRKDFPNQIQYFG